jgi:hypothetical protein
VADTFQIANGDVIISFMNGRPVLINAGTKFDQDMQELLAEDQPVGAGIDRLVGVVPVDPLTFTTSADIQVRNAAQRYQTLQQTDSITPRQPNEIFSSIAFLQFVQSNVTPTNYLFRVDFMSQAGTSSTQAGITGPGLGQ